MLNQVSRRRTENRGLLGTSSHDDDGDALCCLDPELRSDINTAVKKVTNHSAAVGIYCTELFDPFRP